MLHSGAGSLVHREFPLFGLVSLYELFVRWYHWYHAAPQGGSSFIENFCCVDAFFTVWTVLHGPKLHVPWYQCVMLHVNLNIIGYSFQITKIFGGGHWGPKLNRGPKWGQKGAKRVPKWVQKGAKRGPKGGRPCDGPLQNWTGASCMLRGTNVACCMVPS